MTFWIVDIANNIEARFDIIETVETASERDIREYTSYSDNSPSIVIRSLRPYRIGMTVTLTSGFEAMKRKLSYLQMSGLDLLLVMGDLQEATLGGIVSIDRADTPTSVNLQRNDIRFIGNSVLLGHAREAEDISTTGGTTVSDANASNGQAVELDASGDIVYFDITQSKWELPEGDYTMYARAKDTGAVANDFKLEVYNQTDSSSIASGTNTLDSSYKWYSLDFTLDSVDVDDTIRFKASKDTVTANTITVDLIAVVVS